MQFYRSPILLITLSLRIIMLSRLLMLFTDDAPVAAEAAASITHVTPGTPSSTCALRSSNKDVWLSYRETRFPTSDITHAS